MQDEEGYDTVVTVYHCINNEYIYDFRECRRRFLGTLALVSSLVTSTKQLGQCCRYGCRQCVKTQYRGTVLRTGRLVPGSGLINH